MQTLLANPWMPYIVFAFACLTAWKAAGLMEVESKVMAVAFGAAFAFVAPFLVVDYVTLAISESIQVTEGYEEVAQATPRLIAAMSRVGFALVGVAVWCGIERRA